MSRAPTRARPLVLVLVLLAAGVVAACGDGDEQLAARMTTLEQIENDPQAWNEGPVRVRGRAFPREAGFFLVDDGVALWVAAPAGTTGIEPDEPVTVRGEVEELTEENATEVAQALRLEDDPGLPRTALRAIRATPADIGEPFIVLRKLGGRSETPP